MLRNALSFSIYISWTRWENNTWIQDFILDSVLGLCTHRIVPCIHAAICAHAQGIWCASSNAKHKIYTKHCKVNGKGRLSVSLSFSVLAQATSCIEQHIATISAPTTTILKIQSWWHVKAKWHITITCPYCKILRWVRVQLTRVTQNPAKAL